MRRVAVDPRFPARLRELRQQRHLSLRELGQLAVYSHTYLWEFEKGIKAPTADVAARLDAALGVDGELSRMVVNTRAPLTPDDEDRLTAAAHRPRQVDHTVLDSLGILLAEQRRIEDTVGAVPMIAPVVGQLTVVSSLVKEARNDVRPAVLDVAAQWAQYAGWLHIAAERPGKAARWLGRALEWATEVGDSDLASTVLSFKGHQAWLSGQVARTVELSEAARGMPGVYVGQRAYDAYQQARGLAVIGDGRAVDLLLGEADDLAAATAEYRGDVRPWHYYRLPAFYDLERGLVHRLLGREKPEHNQRAVDLLAGGLAGLPPEMREAEWAGEYAYHLAAAHLQVRDVASAHRVAAHVRAVARATNSGRLRSLLATLGPDLSANGSADSRTLPEDGA
jgi:transcriptional regulator with XRE-family HTH domain